MNRRILLAGSVFALCMAMPGSSRVGARSQIHRFNYENVLGTSAEIKILAASEAAAENAQQAAMHEVDRLDNVLSGYRESSEFSRWAKTSGEAVPVSPDLAEVLRLFDEWRNRTGGALDASAETASRVWKRAAAEGRVPTATELADAVQKIKTAHWRMEGNTATRLSAAPLVLNSLAKSYVIGKAATAASAISGVSGVVVNIGGDIVVRGSLMEQVAIADPKSDAEGTSIAALGVSNLAVATSGNYRRGFDIAGRHYSHIIDPRTAQPTGDVISSTVVSADAATAGALATAFSVMKPAESQLLASLTPGVEYLIIRANSQRLQSAGWNALAARALPATRRVAPLLAAAAGPQFDASMELNIQVELARFEGRGKRPYLAVWLVDQDKFPVRTVALWFDKTRWLPEMRAWYKDDRLRIMAEGNDITRSVSSATRAAGKYTIKWDGKDNSGKLVKAGKYTVMIECAREHGTYQLLKQEIDFSGTPKQVTFPAGTELTSASLDYRKVQ